jgi:predicted RNA-binding protein with PIN domain
MELIDLQFSYSDCSLILVFDLKYSAMVSLECSNKQSNLFFSCDNTSIDSGIIAKLVRQEELNKGI